MAKTFEKAVTGFNHNIKYKGRVYHVQTEDSGVNNPHIITHLFVGGNILASKKTSYADILNAESLSEVVRELMEEQHKEMLRNLINGVYDGYETGVRHYQPGQLGSAEESHAARPQAAPVPKAPPPVAAPAASALPPEIAAARAMKVQPKINEVGVETLFGEDLISEKSLDEVILSYLAGEDNNQ
ncbi:hypothetical protein [Melittangium boletus]|uniref:Uncharacterized protein n=1 Tax=Melittangium boletus DSM 14713 TaxID=1294270 RepID=A0A250I9Z8_9BACT|nr:hypothetical protein [Melittangium boletus]ATB27957.1 hypothetical protein MEBOL_001402 [Melittangium boletus DSM 14713]